MSYRVLSLAVIFAVGCEEAPMSTLDAPPPEADISEQLRGPAAKVDICHWDEDAGAFHIININGNAVDKHIANHGDGYPGTYYADADGDGYGDPAGAISDCPNPGTSDNADDCDDGDASVWDDCSVAERITDPGEAYGHHGACSGWNGCGNAQTCADWACQLDGASVAVSHDGGQSCQLYNVCHLFYSQGNIQWNWGNWCGVSGGSEIICE